MKIKWYGHSAFYIVTDNGTRIIIDPYESGAFGGAISYGKITDQADIVLTTHDHSDHNYVNDIKGKFTRLREAGEHEEKGVKIKAVPTYHDTSKGNERGKNLVFVISADGISIAHLGDLGHTLDQKTLEKIGKVDVLLLPVGGFFTIDAKDATMIMNDIKAPITIPMHYKTAGSNLPIAPLDEFTGDKKNVKRPNSSEIVISTSTLPETGEIVVLQHAL
ncbi:MAG TPA: MBL fold metallo-hydrolase [Syntrophorhabdaceae bacterium]|nr:MBL fold metallo-hydrolase [Syntrophorhabdaceae bacterium]